MGSYKLKRILKILKVYIKIEKSNYKIWRYSNRKTKI